MQPGFDTPNYVNSYRLTGRGLVLVSGYIDSGLAD